MPNLATVIPAMDHIDEKLTNQSRDHAIEPSIRVALSIAKKTLNRYYDKTDDSEVYRIAMSKFDTLTTSSAQLLIDTTSLAPSAQVKIF
jgi:hypothetical protein